MTENGEENRDAPAPAPFRLAWDVLKHPVTSLVVGIGLAVGFHQLSQKGAAPSFATSFSETIASAESTDPRLVITWDGKRIPGVSAARVLLWNAGTDYVDPADFLRPITIIPAEPVQLLDVQVLRTSRRELRFTSAVQMDSILKRQVIRLAVVGDEVLERDDGALVRILYASARRDSLSGVGFQVTGRIKGVLGGFRRLKWNEANAHEPGPATIVILLLWAAFLVGATWEIVRDWRADNYRQKALHVMTVAVLAVMLVVMVRNATAAWPTWAPGTETETGDQFP